MRHSFDFSHIEAVMVDLDGTMVDTMGDFEAALNLCLADIDLPKVSPSVVNIAVGKGSEHLIRTVLRHQLDLPEVKASGMVCDNTGVENLFEPAFARYQHHYEKVNGKFADVYAGVLPGLQQLHARGLKMACLTNKPIAIHTMYGFTMVVPIGDQHHRALRGTRGQRIVLRVSEHQRVRRQCAKGFAGFKQWHRVGFFARESVSAIHMAEKTSQPFVGQQNFGKRRRFIGQTSHL